MYRLGPPTPVLLLKLGTSPPTVELQLQVVINVWMKVLMVRLPFPPAHFPPLPSCGYILDLFSLSSLVLAFIANSQVLRLINVPLEIPIKVSPSIICLPHSDPHPPSQTSFGFHSLTQFDSSAILSSTSTPRFPPTRYRSLTFSMDHQTQDLCPSPIRCPTQCPQGNDLPRPRCWWWKANPSLWKGRFVFNSSRWGSYLWDFGSSVRFPSLFVI